MQTVAVATSALLYNSDVMPGRIVLLFTGCDVTDEVLLVPVAPDALQWIFAGNPAIPASDSFPTAGEAWAFAWQVWARQIQIAENYPFSTR